ncbi:MAG: inverse autotransporter beta domain-containing protein, partial [Candidatus Aquirickettsiella gammari]
YLPPRLSVDANAGGSATVGQADLLLSLKGDERRNLYLDPQAAYGTDEQWYADLGLGYRWIQNDAAILGGYVFASRSQVARQSGFWIANPGVEAMGSRWDARINGYIPIGGRSDDLGIVQFNQSSRFVFSGHTAQIVTTYLTGDESQQIGDGVDAKVGYQVFRNVPLKAYLGAYFFNISNADNVRGGAAGVEYWFDQHVKAFVNYTYDNLQYNTVVGGLAVSFGGVDESRADPSLSERLTDPVERYLANLGHGSGIPSETLLTNLQTGQSSSNSQFATTSMAFFSQNGTPNNGGLGLSIASCTFENPCGPTDFTQTGVNILNTLLPNTVMLFNGGTYPATNGSSALTLNNGQGVFGMNANYSASASGAARPTFNGAFILNGNNTLDSIILNNSLAANTVAITSTGGQNLVINNAVIGSAGTPYGAALSLTNVVSALLRQSTVNVSANLTLSSPGNVSFTGLALSGSSLVVQSSNISAVSANPASPPAMEVIALVNGSSLQFNNSNLTIINTPPIPTTGATFVAAIGVSNASIATINAASNISITSSPSQAQGAFTSLAIFDTSMIEMTGGTLITNGSPNAQSRIIAGTGTIVVNGVACTVNSIPGVTC